MIFRLVCCVLLFALTISVSSADDPTVRVGLLKFGTVSWEIDTIRSNELDSKHGIAVVPVEFASNEAAKIALQAGAVDLIVTDWPWVTRQRAEGAGFSFVPYSKAVGTLMVQPDSDIRSLADLKGKRIGIVGGPLDKSWLLLRALARKELGVDLAEVSEPVFGAPPLLNEELARARIDAVLTYWHYAARLAAEGARPVMTVADMIRQLGIRNEVPMLGYAFQENWAKREGKALEGFVAASREAKSLLANSKEEWVRLAPHIGSDKPPVLAALQEGYRAGIPQRWGNDERQAGVDLYAILVSLGGEKLVGRAKSVDPETFWPSVTY